MTLSLLGFDGEFFMCPEAGIRVFQSENKGDFDSNVKYSRFMEGFLWLLVHFQVQSPDAQVQRNLVVQSFQLERIWRLMEGIQICSQIQVHNFICSDYDPKNKRNLHARSGTQLYARTMNLHARSVHDSVTLQ
ncbi:uncharacterized protein LOC107433016 isoform X2 [Ziziphus jujuba]|uniref:Uncharacterized protein LOC107433016 isoform X2 n=1 Tax=Ziziphus jujuba TaxID=326968 RepID=A0ABM3ZZF6_ZIZJJ|nr:uncharacterized protein LOC107433016 isoform X2 [Ziziphus jujuba]